MATDTGQAILARFPGPVTLTAGKLRMLLGLAIFSGLLVFCVFVLVPKLPDAGSYDVVMTVLATLVCTVITVRLVIMLLEPGALALTLDADGFAIRRIFWRDHWRWRDVGRFRVEETDDDLKVRLVRYDLLNPAGVPQRRGAKKDTGALPLASYSLSLEDIAWLMGEWRERALVLGRHSVVPHIAERT